MKNSGKSGSSGQSLCYGEIQNVILCYNEWAWVWHGLSVCYLPNLKTEAVGITQAEVLSECRNCWVSACWVIVSAAMILEDSWCAPRRIQLMLLAGRIRGMRSSGRRLYFHSCVCLLEEYLKKNGNRFSRKLVDVIAICQGQTPLTFG